jgi:hypothetical protein
MSDLVGRHEIEPVISRAIGDKAFRKEFIKNPKAVLERELGFKFAKNVKFTVHQESLRDVHIILPAELKASDVEGQRYNTTAVGGVRG